ncbi:MAG: N-6 DNA methylase [Phycisphaerales bacterium]|nr:N-6 DNA methylase [Phycisphaerales bacterium]
MHSSKEEGLLKVKDLVDRFDKQKGSYEDVNYNEANTRKEFIDHFFIALGYDVYNTDGAAESYKEVVFEDKVRIRDNGTDKLKSPDYSFSLSGIKKLFFVEAKKPSVDIRNNQDSAYQIRRYGWSARLPISIITNFEDFIVYDCTKKPNVQDKPTYARVQIYNYKEYEKYWNDIWNTLSKDAVKKGDFDRFFNSSDNKKGTHTVDVAFLETLDNIRTILAESIIKDNKDLKEDELNFIVQQTLDRIIFLRICEDRGIEPYGNLKNCLYGDDFYELLIKQFKKANTKYNSGIFDFTKDTLTKNVQINNKIIRHIIEDLYYPTCPYEFSVLEVDILGRAYEQFLGKTITINSKGKTVIELKPEVRKSGGVYYTPQYIVNYIVENTVGKLIKDKTPQEVSEIKIVDPACGSGSFLLGAYQYLIDWHNNYYKKNKTKKNPIKPDGNLNIDEKKKILVNNIFGVDIDTNAVEVTKLSLLLKCMENESVETVKQLDLFDERLLPNIDANIKSGNSLIDSDYYDSQLDFGEVRKIKPFNWHNGFPDVFKNGGFDVIIGNPPYVNIENLKDDIKKYFYKKYKTCVGRTDLYILFIENKLNNLKANGLISFIVPYAFTNQNYGALLRKLLSQKYGVTEIVDTSKYYVFDQAKVKNVIITIQNHFSKNNKTIIKSFLSAPDFINKTGNEFTIAQNQFLQLENNRFETKPIYNFLNLKDKICKKSICLEKICLVAYGARLNHKSQNINKSFYVSKEHKKGYKPFVEGENIERYFYTNYGWLNYKPLEHYNPMFPELFETEKLITIRIVKDRMRFAYDNKNMYNSHTVINCVKLCDLVHAKHISAIKAINNFEVELSKKYAIKFILGLLNSKLLNWYFYNFLSDQLNLYPNAAKSLPIIIMDDRESINFQNSMVQYVNTLLVLNTELGDTKLVSKKEQVYKQIDYFENKIDQMVYQLYNLSEEEINIIEDYFKVS